MNQLEKLLTTTGTLAANIAVGTTLGNADSSGVMRLAKLAHRFLLLDTDGDGIIRPEPDFARIALNLERIRHYHTHGTVTALEGAYHSNAHWLVAKAGTTDIDAVTFARTCLTHDWYPDPVEQWFDTVADVGDWTLSAHLAFAYAVGAHDTTAVADVFGGNESLDRTQVFERFAGFYLSESYSSPENSWFGPVPAVDVDPTQR